MHRTETPTPKGAWMAIYALVALTLLAVMTQPPLAGGASNSNQVQLTVTDSGFTPAAATAAAGLIHLSVDNQSADAALTLRVTRGGGELVRELAAPEGARQWQLELDLGAGSYVIKAAGHASWSFALTVQ